MPTIRSTSSERCAICSLLVTPCDRIASRYCAPTDRTGLSAFMALCMTTDMSFHRMADISSSVSPTRFRPRKVTLPPVMAAGGYRSCATAKSRVVLPQPDSPTMPRNSPAATSRLTWSTALITPRSSRYWTERSRTSSSGPCGGTELTTPWESSASVCVIGGELPPHGDGECGLLPRLLGPQRAQRRVADFVEGVVEQRERGTKQGDAQPGDDLPQVQAALQRALRVRPVQRRPPAHHAGVT